MLPHPYTYIHQNGLECWERHPGSVQQEKLVMFRMCVDKYDEHTFLTIPDLWMAEAVENHILVDYNNIRRQKNVSIVLAI